MAGNILFKMSLDSKDMSKKLESVEGKIDKLGKTSEKSGNLMKSAFAMSVMYRALGKFNEALAASTRAVLDFENSLHALKGLANESNDWVDSMSETFRRLSLGVEHSSTAISGAMSDLKRMGDTDVEALARMPHLLDAVSATGLSMSDIMMSTAATMKSFGIEAKYTEDVIDRLIATADNSPQTFTDLQEALKNVQPTAASLGMTLEDTLALIAVGSETGLKSGRAGIALRNALLNMHKPGQAVAEVFKDMNLEGMAFHEILKAVGEDVTVIEMLDTVDKRSISFVEHIAQSGDAIERMNAIIDGSSGSTARRADEMRESWSTAFTSIGKNISELGVNYAMAFDELSSSDLLGTINDRLVEFNEAILNNPEGIRLLVKALDAMLKVVGFLAKNIDVLVGATISYKMAMRAVAIESVVFDAALVKTALSVGGVKTAIVRLIAFAKGSALFNPVVLAIVAITTATINAISELDRMNKVLDKTAKAQGDMSLAGALEQRDRMAESAHKMQVLMATFDQLSSTPTNLDQEHNMSASYVRGVREIRNEVAELYAEKGLALRGESKLLGELGASSGGVASSYEGTAAMKEFVSIFQRNEDYIRVLQTRPSGYDEYQRIESADLVPQESDGGSGGGDRVEYFSEVFDRALQSLPEEMAISLMGADFLGYIPEFTQMMRFKEGEREEALAKAVLAFQSYSDKERISAYGEYTKSENLGYEGMDFRQFNDTAMAFTAISDELQNEIVDTESYLKISRAKKQALADFESTMWSSMQNVSEQMTQAGVVISSPLIKVNSYSRQQDKSRSEVSALQNAYDNGEVGESALARIDEINSYMEATRDAYINNTVAMGMSTVTAGLDAFDKINEAQYDRMVAMHNKEISLLENKEATALRLAGSSERRQIQVLELFAKKKRKLSEDQEAEEVEFNRRRQVIQVAQATMNTASAIMQIWADPTAGNTIMKGILSGSVAALGATQIGLIAQAKFSTGTGNRRVNGFAGNTTDLVNVMVSPEEMIISGDNVTDAGGPDAVDQIIRDASSQSIGGNNGATVIMQIENLIGSVPDEVAIQVGSKINELTALNTF